MKVGVRKIDRFVESTEETALYSTVDAKLQQIFQYLFTADCFKEKIEFTC